MKKKEGKSKLTASNRSGMNAFLDFSLERAKSAAELRNFDEALEWLASAGAAGAPVQQLEAEVHYARGVEFAAESKPREAERDFALTILLAKGNPKIPTSLIQERLHLLRRRRSATHDLAELRERYGKSCPRCGGVDFYAVASCAHQRAPIPAALKLRQNMLAPAVRNVFAAAAYRSGWDPDRSHPLSVLIRGAKSEIDRAALRLLGALLADFAAYHTPLVRLVDAVIPVPTSREREENRGGSIPFALAATIRDQLVIPLHEPIVQVGAHLDHTQARGQDRSRGLRTAWRSKRDNALVGRNVLLVDDILTTGTTMSTAAEMLLESGIERVYGLALMHTERSQ